MARRLLDRSLRHELLSEYECDLNVRRARGGGLWAEQYDNLRRLYGLSQKKVPLWDSSSVLELLDLVSGIVAFCNQDFTQNESGTTLVLFAIDIHIRFATFFELAFPEFLLFENVKSQYGVINASITTVIKSCLELQDESISILLTRRISRSIEHIKERCFASGSPLIIEIMTIAEKACAVVSKKPVVSEISITHEVFSSQLEPGRRRLEKPQDICVPYCALPSFSDDEIQHMTLKLLVNQVTFAILRFNYARYKSIERLKQDHEAGRLGSVVGEPFPGLYDLVDQWDEYIESHIVYNRDGEMSHVTKTLPKDALGNLLTALGFYLIQLTNPHARVAVDYNTLIITPYERLMSYVTSQKPETDTLADETVFVSGPMDCSK